MDTCIHNPPDIVKVVLFCITETINALFILIYIFLYYCCFLSGVWWQQYYFRSIFLWWSLSDVPSLIVIYVSIFQVGIYRFMFWPSELSRKSRFNIILILLNYIRVVKDIKRSLRGWNVIYWHIFKWLNPFFFYLSLGFLVGF